MQSRPSVKRIHSPQTRQSGLMSGIINSVSGFVLMLIFYGEDSPHPWPDRINAWLHKLNKRGAAFYPQLSRQLTARCWHSSCCATGGSATSPAGMCLLLGTKRSNRTVQIGLQYKWMKRLMNEKHSQYMPGHKTTDACQNKIKWV